MWRLPSGLEPAGGLLGLLEILLARAPEDDAAGHAPDRDGDGELADADLGDESGLDEGGFDDGGLDDGGFGGDLGGF